MLRMPVICAVLAVALAGCGDEDRAAPTPTPADRAEIERTVPGFYAALAADDASAACDLFTADARRDSLATSGRTCTEAIERTGAGIPKARREKIGEVTVQDVVIEGDRAAVTLRSDAPYISPTAPPELDVERTPAGWRIAKLVNRRGKGVVDKCIEGGLADFDRGKGDPYWRREGRDKWALFLSRFCYVAERRGLLAAGQGFDASRRGDRELTKLSKDVIEELVAEGRISDPR